MKKKLSLEKLLTVIYYTSNRENEAFEKKIRDKLLKTIGDIPLISVSQKPIDFGKNICVGDVGVSNQNVGRQIQIGAEAATTPFIIMAEADCIYPKEYFSFVPPRDDIAYRYDNLWILWKKGGPFRRKIYSECGQVLGREYAIASLKNYCVGRGMWRADLEHGREVPPSPYSGGVVNTYQTNIPIINIKTDEGQHKSTRTMYNVEPVDSLPFWGTADEIRKEMFV